MDNSAEIQARNLASRKECHAQKIDPLNKKLYGPLTQCWTVTDIKAAAAF